jgi:hypothetical protein
VKVPRITPLPLTRESSRVDRLESAIGEMMNSIGEVAAALVDDDDSGDAFLSKNPSMRALFHRMGVQETREAVLREVRR